MRQLNQTLNAAIGGVGAEGVVMNARFGEVRWEIPSARQFLEHFGVRSPADPLFLLQASSTGKAANLLEGAGALRIEKGQKESADVLTAEGKFCLGMAYLKKKRSEEGESALREALTLGLNEEEAEEAKEALGLVN